MLLNKPYKIDERTQLFALCVRKFVKTIPSSLYTLEDIKQLLRSSGSVAANFIEANEAVSKKDKIYRIKICKKETRESMLWLTLLQENIDDSKKAGGEKLIGEANELMKIFGSIVNTYNNYEK